MLCSHNIHTVIHLYSKNRSESCKTIACCRHVHLKAETISMAENRSPSANAFGQIPPLHDSINIVGRGGMLRAEHERAMSLLAKEKAAAVAAAAAAQEKGRKVEAALQTVAMAQEDLDRQAREHQEKV